MAEINNTSRKSNGKYAHKLVRVDLTPMVDLGFLLITFFILTTSLEKLSVMKLALPKDSPIKTPVRLSQSLTVILERNDSIGYYEGNSDSILHTGFASLRHVILEKQMLLEHGHIDKHLLTIIIKPTNESSYKNLIDALDEITIADCRRYFVTEPSKQDLMN